MIQNALFFWIGDLYSTLIFKQWNAESKAVYQLEAQSSWNAFAKIGDNILVGEDAIKAQAMNQASAFYMEGCESLSLNPETTIADKDDFSPIDQQAILLKDMLQRLAPRVKELCGVDPQILETLHLLDPGNFFSENPQRLIGAMTAGCCFRGYYYSRQGLLSALMGVTDQDAPVFVVADQTRENLGEPTEGCKSVVQVSKLFNSLVVEQDGSFQDSSQALLATVRLLKQHQNLGYDDRIEITGGYHTRQARPLVVDSLHFFQALKSSLSSPSEPIRDNQVYIGDFSQMYLGERTQNYDLKEQAWLRRDVISRLPGKIDTLPPANKDKLKLLINNEPCDLMQWDTTNDSISGRCSKSINLFGNTCAELEVQLADLIGPIVFYSFQLMSDQPLNTADYEIDLSLYNGGAIACELLPGEPLEAKLVGTRHYRKDGSQRNNDLLNKTVNIN